MPFSREIFIEQEDFMEEPPKKYFRLFPGNEVRLKSAYFVKCVSVEKDADGNIIAVHCTYDPETKGGDCATRKVKGTIHWVNAEDCVDAEVRLYENIIDEEKGKLNEDGTLTVNVSYEKLSSVTVHTFQAQIPVVHEYTWGKLNSYITVTVKPTVENAVRARK